MNNRKTNCQEAKIPSKGVMFFGGHPNLVKKLQRIYPEWDYVSDEQVRRKASFKRNIIFYWTGHGSHQLMEYVYSRTSSNTKVLYVTATNLPLLLNEMNTAYSTITKSYESVFSESSDSCGII